MFNRFAERYLCAVYRLKNLGIRITPESYRPANIGRSRVKYSYKGADRLDPLSFMLEGTSCTGHCYGDYSEEYAVPLQAMQAFKLFISGYDSNNDWSLENPHLKEQLKLFGFAIYYLMCESYTSARQALDGVEELNGKDKIKTLITSPKKKEVYLHINLSNNRLW